MEYKIQKPNRTTRQQAKHGLFWCYCCDRQIVGIGAKCTNCGNVNKKNKGTFKKPLPVE